MSGPRLDRVVGVRGTATPDELAALLAALAHQLDRAENDPYEQWRHSRVVALARASARDVSRHRCQIRRPQPRRLSTDPAAAPRL